MMKPGMPQPGMQSMPYPQPAAPQAPLPPYLQALFPSGLPPMATLGAGQATQVVPGQMQSPQLQDLGQMQPMSQMSLPPYLQALLGGLPQGAMGLPMQAMQNADGYMGIPQMPNLTPNEEAARQRAADAFMAAHPSQNQLGGFAHSAFGGRQQLGGVGMRQPMGQGSGMMPSPLEAASLAPQSGPFRPFSFLRGPSNKLNMP